MAVYPLWAAALLAWHYGTPTAAYPDYCPNGIATLDIQPIKILTKTPVLVSTHVEHNTNLVIDDGHTVYVTKAPTNVITVITITNTGSTTTSSLEPGHPGESTKTNGTPPPNTKTAPGGSGGPPKSSQTKGPSNSNTKPTDTNTSGPIESNTGKPSSVKPSSVAGSEASSKPNQSSALPASSAAPSSKPAESSEASSSSKGEASSKPAGSSAAPASSATASSTPASSAPASSTPASSAPASSDLASSAPASSAPASSGPVSSAPASSATASSTPASSAPASSAPASSAPASSAPASSAPASSAPASSAPASSAPASSAPASSGPVSSAPASSTMPSSTKTQPSSTCASAPAATSVCATSLPDACTKLGTLNGLAIVPQILTCTTALGLFAVGNVSTCLLTTNIDVFSKGQTVLTCLENAIGGACLTKLPDACTGLAGATGVGLVTKVATCTAQLGPFAVGDTLLCLTKGLTNGDDIIACLLKALGLPDGSGGGGTCSPSPQACVSELPPDCSVISDLVGTAIIPQLTNCVTALGTYAVGAVTTCLDPLKILAGTQGSSVVSCVLDALSGVCIQALPDACSNLISVSQGELTTDIPKCIAALGPFASGGVLDCLSPAPASGQAAVTCITKALFGSTSPVRRRRRA